MKIRCWGCGVEKDTDVKEFWTLDDSIVQTCPITPLFVVHCEGREETTGIWKVVVVCHVCLHKLDADLWISDHCWSLLDPKVPFSALPLLSSETVQGDPTQWPHIEVPHD